MKTAKSRGPVDTDTIAAVLKRVFAENARDHVKGYVFTIFCLLVVAGTTAFTAWIMDSIINEAFVNRRADLAFLICGGIFLAFFIRGLASYGQSVALSKIGNNIVARYQKRLYSHLMKLSVGYLSESRSAHLAAQVSQNIGGIRDVMNLTVTSVARDLLTFIALVGVMIFKDPFLSIIIVFIVPPLVLGLRYIAKRLRETTR